MPLFSIITINRNNAAGLKKTIESVVSQTFNDFEYLIIDGASNDESVEVIKKSEEKVSYWVSEKDDGIYAAMNKGIKKATGEYVLFLNSGDCFAETTILQKVAAVNPRESLVSGNILFSENGKLRADSTPGKLTKFYLLHSMLYHPVTFIRKTAFVDVGFYDERYKIVADYEFFLRIIYKTKISYRHLDFTICIFDNSGISAKQEFRKLLEKERSDAQKKYFTAFVLFVFRMYRTGKSLFKK